MNVYAGPAIVTLGYVLLYYLMIVNVLRVRSNLGREAATRGERFDRYTNVDKRMLAADRVQLNTLEHMPPFLALLWLVAVFVSPRHATLAGGIYLAARSAYPFAVGPRVGSGPPRRVLPFTYMGYAVLGFLWVDLALKCIRTLV